MKALNPCLNKYKDSSGYFVLATLDTNKHFKQMFFDSEQIQEANNYIEKTKNINCYNSIATFKEPVRSKLTIDSIHLNYIDIDSHIFGLSQKQAEEIAEDLKQYYNNTIPEPSSIIYTGRGFQMLFNLYGAVDSVKWQLIQEGLLNRLTEIVNKYNDTFIFPELNVDPIKDTTRILRTPGTKNTAAGCYSEVIYNSGRIYTQAELLENYNLYSVEKGQRKPLKDLVSIRSEDITQASIKQLRHYYNKNRAYTIATLNTARVKDLLKLISIRNKAGQLEGYRNNLINIASEIIRTTTSDINNLLEQLRDINRYFEKPLKDSELTAWASLKLKNPAYYFRHSTIIKVLNITEAEQRQLTVIHSKKLVNETYYQNNKEQVKNYYKNKYKTTKEQTAAARSEKIAQAKKLYKKGLTMQLVATKLNVNKSTVSRWLKKS